MQVPQQKVITYQLLISSKYIHCFPEDAGGMAIPSSWNSPRNFGCKPSVRIYEAETSLFTRHRQRKSIIHAGVTAPLHIKQVHLKGDTA